MRQDRRDILASGLIATVGFTLPRTSAAQELAATPECRSGTSATLRQTEGPFYKPNTPERSDLIEAGMPEQVIELTGFVLTRGCQPVTRAIVDLWHADGTGAYDTRGFRLRGHQFTDAAGRFRFRTVVPAIYPGRTRHFHVKVAGASRLVLTTQLYFPNDPGNASDGLFRKELLMRVTPVGSGLSARFDFVLDTA